jgi:hypothetical protein
MAPARPATSVFQAAQKCSMLDPAYYPNNALHPVKVPLKPLKPFKKPQKPPSHQKPSKLPQKRKKRQKKKKKKKKL